MKKLVNIIKKYSFILLLILFFILIDTAVSKYFSNRFLTDYYLLNDFEITQRDHPEEAWDKVIFGNSTIIAAYREDYSESDYINLGMDYGVVTDLWKILDQGHREITSEIVIGLNWLTLYDEFDTNPNYIWHKKIYEPFTYFRRDRIFAYIQRLSRQIFLDEESYPQHAGQSKIVYYGTMSQAELDEKNEKFIPEYYNLIEEDFDENMDALEKIIDYAEGNDIRVRVLWMPWNPSLPKPQVITDVKERVNDLCEEKDIEVFDMMDTLGEESFYDIGHLNYEFGSYQFMEEVDPWLNSKK